MFLLEFITILAFLSLNFLWMLVSLRFSITFDSFQFKTLVALLFSYVVLLVTLV